MEGKNQFFLVLLDGIEKGLIRKELEELTRKFLNVKTPRQTLYYYLNQLLDRKLIEINDPSAKLYSVKSYKLTHLGRKGKENLIQSQKHNKTPLKPLWRCHNLIVGFHVLKIGDFNFIPNKNRKIVDMINWKYAKEKVEDHSVVIQDTGLLKIYCPEQYGTDPDTEFSKMYSQAHIIAQRYCDKYSIELKPMHIVRKGHKELANSEALAEFFGYGKINKDIWTDHSKGTLNLEERQGSNDFEDFIKEMPKQLNNLNSTLPELKRTLAGLTKQMEMHLRVMRKIGYAHERQTDILDHLDQEITKLNEPKEEKLGTTNLDQIKDFWRKKGKKIE